MPALVLLFMLLAPTTGRGEDGSLVVIVHPERRAELSTEDVAHIYLRRKRFWDNGTPIVPLNLPSGTPLRRRFTDLVLRQSESRLADYWNRQYFYGTLPPATLASTGAVVRYVAADRNAIGYVPVSEADGSVRVLFRLE
jgi:ABC-type phosphate transport system substrate-binding protein